MADHRFKPETLARIPAEMRRLVCVCADCASA